jgi:hypothetical protein
MAPRVILKLINYKTLTTGQKREIRKILSDRKREIESGIKLLDRALAKKRKSKRTTKR